jgi:ribosome recycling factor
MVSDIRKQTQEKMAKSFDALKNDLSKIRTGRASPGILDHIMVDYYGNPTALPQVASVALSDARTLTVSPWEKNMIAAIEKAIRISDLGLNPATSGTTIRVPMPALTEERRKELVKVVKSQGEEGKIAIRNIRRDANNQLKELLKAKTISEDDERRGQEEIQKMTDKLISDIDGLLVEKEKEVLTV